MHKIIGGFVCLVFGGAICLMSPSLMEQTHDLTKSQCVGLLVMFAGIILFSVGMDEYEKYKGK